MSEEIEKVRKPAPDVSSMHTLKVDNISFRTTKEELEEIFSKFGDVGDIYIPRIHNSFEPRGFAFVRFVNKSDSEDALRSMDSKEIDGRTIRIQEAKEKKHDKPVYQRANR